MLGLTRKVRYGEDFFGPISEEAQAFSHALGDSAPWMGDKEFDLKMFSDEMFDTGYVGTANVIREFRGSDAAAFWADSKLYDQWPDRTEEDREDALITAIRFQNRLDGAEYEFRRRLDQSQLVLLTAHATIRLKALLLGTAFDATYRTQHLETIAADVLSYGVHEIGADQSE